MLIKRKLYIDFKAGAITWYRLAVMLRQYQSYNVKVINKVMGAPYKIRTVS